MKQKLKQIQQRIDTDPKLQKAVKSIKPQKSIWGILGIVVFFFVPEIITYIWQEELIAWSHVHAVSEPIVTQRWIYKQLEEMFISGVSYVNITVGAVLLFWVLHSK